MAGNEGEIGETMQDMSAGPNSGFHTLTLTGRH